MASFTVSFHNTSLPIISNNIKKNKFLQKHGWQLKCGYTSPGDHKHASGLTKIKQVGASIKCDVFRRWKRVRKCEQKDTGYFQKRQTFFILYSKTCGKVLNIFQVFLKVRCFPFYLGTRSKAVDWVHCIVFSYWKMKLPNLKTSQNKQCSTNLCAKRN